MVLFSYVLTGVVFLVSIAYLYLRSRHNYWRDRGFPYVREKPHLLYGHMEKSFTKKHASYINQDLYKDLKSRGEAIGGMSFFMIPGLITTDPELVKTILVKDFNVFHDRGVYNDAKSDPLSAHLFALEGQEWRVLRQKLTPTFTSGRMKQMFGTIQQVADEFLKYMNENCHREIEMKDVLARFTTDVIGTCAFGIECNTLKDPESDFRKYGNMVFEQDVITVVKFVFASLYKNLAKRIGVKLTNEGVERFFLQVVRDTVEYREKNNVQRNDFMNLLLQIKNKGRLDDQDGESVTAKGDVGLTQNELAAQAFVFFIAGFETSSTTMNFCLYELAMNPEIQERLREEINQAVDENDGQVTYEMVMNNQYLDNVINETLRKYPPVESLSRVPMYDYTIPGTKLVIPKDTFIQIPVYAMQHDEEFYPEPERFNPDRFLPEEVKKRHPYTFLPFGEGPRVCIGLRFGVMQAKLGLITLLRNFRFSPTSRTPSQIVFDPKSFIISPSTGNYLKVDKV
ncbi:probable cytochrome P450 6a14 [Anopheles nili]|uniref:probable cytochrome P450 6a14 n=1 Tax=Anopheles nili TaxID=185578 RepID=UPI00237A7EBF|nr:probable cytochrome P450 6a14 [Anopheles nili]